MAATPTQGNVVIAGIVTNGVNLNPLVNSITQTNVTWAKVTEKGTTSTNCYTSIWLGVVGANPSIGVSVNLSSTDTSRGAIADLFEYSGLLTSDYTDRTANAEGSSTTVPTGNTATTTQADELWFGASGGNRAYNFSNPTNGFTLYDGMGFTYTVLGTVHKIVSATGSAGCSVTASTSLGYDSCIATFKASATGTNVTVSDSLGLSDGTYRNKPSLSLADTLGVSESPLRNKALTITDAVSAQDVLGGNRALAILDIVGLGDSALSMKTLKVTDDCALTEETLSPLRTIAMSESISLTEFAHVGAGGTKKTKLFLVMGDLALQIAGD
jgi:hypothetical protein